MTSLRLSVLFLPLLLLGFLFASACDSGPTIDPEELAGTYTFEQFVFDPDAPILSEANVMDTLVAAETRLELFRDRFNLRYQFRGSSVPEAVFGDFRVDDSRARLNISRQDDARRSRLLLPRELALQIQEDGTLLELSQRMEGVDLSQFSTRYSGIGAVNGTLRLRLRRTGAL